LNIHQNFRRINDDIIYVWIRLGIKGLINVLSFFQQILTQIKQLLDLLSPELCGALCQVLFKELIVKNAANPFMDVVQLFSFVRDHWTGEG
jgi:hypothetical protein